MALFAFFFQVFLRLIFPTFLYLTGNQGEISKWRKMRWMGNENTNP